MEQEETATGMYVWQQPLLFSRYIKSTFSHEHDQTGETTKNLACFWIPQEEAGFTLYKWQDSSAFLKLEQP